MLELSKNHIKNNFPFLKKAKLLIAISGGIDSVVLTHLLHQLNFNITLAHCNFNLREKESDLDENFVVKLANQLEIKYFITHFKTNDYAKLNKLSIQEAARNLRYNWFAKLTEENDLDYVLTAHNLNDNLETFLINLTRGTGLQGLIGIPTINKKTVRPLLEFSREQITVFAKNNDINWREDKSNANTKYTRNKIRHQVVPVLESINPNLLNSFKNTLENLNGSQSIVNDVVNSIPKLRDNIQSLNIVTKFNIQKILETTNPKAYCYEIFKDYGFTEFNDISNLLTSQSGKQIFSKTHRLIKDREYLLLSEIDIKDEKLEVRDKKIDYNDTEFVIKNSKFKIKSKKIQNSKSNIQNLFLFDKDLLKFPLTVRKWQKGDYFYPIGMTGKKKLSKFFKDEKCSLLDKENIWLLLSDNQIVWIIGKRQDNRYKITETTTNTLEITQL